MVDSVQVWGGTGPEMQAIARAAAAEEGGRGSSPSRADVVFPTELLRWSPVRHFTDGGGWLCTRLGCVEVAAGRCCIVGLRKAHIRADCGGHTYYPSLLLLDTTAAGTSMHEER